MVWQPYRVGYIDRIPTPPGSSVSISAQPTDSMYGTIIPSHLAVQNGRGTERVSIIIDGVMYECGQYSNIALPIEDAYNITVVNGNNPDLEVLMIDTIHAERYLSRYTSFPAPLSTEEVSGPNIISATETSCSNGSDGTADIIIGNQLQSSESVTVTVGGSASTKTISAGGTETYPVTFLSPGTHPVSAVYDSSGRSSFTSLHISACVPPPPEHNPIFVVPWSVSVTSDIYAAPGDGIPAVSQAGFADINPITAHPYASAALSNTNSNTTISGAEIESTAFIGRFVQIGFWLAIAGTGTAGTSGMRILALSTGGSTAISDSLIGYEPLSSTLVGCVSNSSRHAITTTGWKWIVVRLDRASPYVSIFVNGTLLAQGTSDIGTVGTSSGRIVVRVTNRSTTPNMTRICDLRVWDRYSDPGITPPSSYFTY